MGSWFEQILGTQAPKELEEIRQREYKRGLIVGYAKGFNAARDKIAKMLEEEGKGITAQKVRKMELVRK